MGNFLVLRDTFTERLIVSETYKCKVLIKKNK